MSMISSMSLNQGFKILIIEDEPITQAIIIKIMLHITKASFYRAHSVEEAQRILSETNVDIIFMDHYLRDGEDSFHLLKHMRSDEVTTPVIMISSDDDIDQAQKAIEFGADDYLDKPLKAKVLKRSVEKFLQIA